MATHWVPESSIIDEPSPVARRKYRTADGREFGVLALIPDGLDVSAPAVAAMIERNFATERDRFCEAEGIDPATVTPADRD